VENSLKKELRKFLLLISAFLIFYIVPFDSKIVEDAILNGFRMLGSYAKEHVLLCLVPAFFIAGSISVFVKREAILKYLGPNAKKIIAYPIAASAGGILAVCSCTILPLFGGIYKRGAGVGPAIAFLFTGPAINVAAIFLTGTVLGWELSIVRLVATVTSAIIVGIIMQAIFKEKGEGGFNLAEDKSNIKQSVVITFIGFQLAFLIVGGLSINHLLKTFLMTGLFIGTIIIAMKFETIYRKSWMTETWDFTKKILPYLLGGVFVAGILTVALPEDLVQLLLGGNRITSTLFGSVFGALMYFATLTEVPIVESFMTLGMGKGPALALFMAGYTLSLPNMIVIVKLLGKKKAFTYFGLVIMFSTFWGFIYGNLF
jgi:hypothetical protein